MTNADAVEFVEELGQVKSVLITTSTGKFSINLNGAPIVDLLREDFDWTFIQNQLCDARELVARFNDWETVKPTVIPRFASKYRRDSREYMEMVCQSNYLDLVVTYHAVLDKEHSATISPLMLEKWGISMNELERAAFSNISDSYLIMDLNGLLLDLGYQPDEEDVDVLNQCDGTMYHLSNKAGKLGAIHMISDGVLRSFCEKLDESIVYIIPSSTHGVLLLPSRRTSMPQDMINEMIVDINKMLDDTEILSNHCYIYNYESDTLSCEGYERVSLKEAVCV